MHDFFCWTQRWYFELILASKQLPVAIHFHIMKKIEGNVYRQPFHFWVNYFFKSCFLRNAKLSDPPMESEKLIGRYLVLNINSILINDKKKTYFTSLNVSWFQNVKYWVRKYLFAVYELHFSHFVGQKSINCTRLMAGFSLRRVLWVYLCASVWLVIPSCWIFCPPKPHGSPSHPRLMLIAAEL